MADTQGTRWRQIKVDDRLGTGPKGQSVDQTLDAVTLAGYASDGVTLTQATLDGTSITITGGVVSAGHQFDEVPSGALDGSNRTFTLSHAPVGSGALKSLHFYLNGVYQDIYWISLSGTAVTFVVAPTAADQIYAEYEY